MATELFIAWFHMDAQLHRPAGGCNKLINHLHQGASHQGK